jgi:hypothetical protein
VTGTARIPEVRALHLRMLLDALPALGPELARAVEERIPAASLQRMRRGGRLAWLPARLLVDACEAAAAVLGEDGLRRWGAAALQAAAGAPLTRAFFLAALGRERHDPGALLSYLFKAWPLLYSGCGDLHMVAREPGSARVLQGPTPEVLRRDATMLPLIGALAAVPAHCGLEGQVEVAPWTAETEWLTYVVTWRRKR